MRIPRPPARSGPQGRKLWRSVLDEFELNGAELAVLRQAVRAADRCEALVAEVAAAGLMTTTAAGSPKLNPAAAELRSAELAVARLLLCLRIPVGRGGGGVPGRPAPRAAGRVRDPGRRGVRRRGRRPVPGPPGVLAAHRDSCAAAAGRGEPGSADRLAAAESWLAMLRGCGGDPEIGALFATFAAEDG
jgi:hypothetical protein